MPGLEGLVAKEDVLFGILLDERTGLCVDDGKDRQLLRLLPLLLFKLAMVNVLELRLKRLLCELSLERNRVPRHLGDVALEVVDLAVVGHEDDLDEIFVLAGLGDVPELLQ